MYVDIGGLAMNGEFPARLASHPTLGYLSLANLPLTGSFPAAFATNSRINTITLLLPYLQGTIPSDWSQATSIFTLAIQAPNFGGNFPSIPPPGINNLYLGNTQISGSLSSLFEGASAPKSLAIVFLVANKKLNGQLPSPTIDAPYQNLIISNMDFNSALPVSLLYRFVSVSFLDVTFEGSLPEPSSLPNGVKCEIVGIHFEKTTFKGGASLPQSLTNCQKLEKIDLEDSMSISGTIPASYGSLPELRSLEITNTQVGGQIPDVKWASSLSYFTVANNSFTGSVPASVFASTALIKLDLAQNQIDLCAPHGSLPKNANYLCTLTPQRGFSEPSASCKSEYPSACRRH